MDSTVLSFDGTKKDVLDNGLIDESVLDDVMVPEDELDENALLDDVAIATGKTKPTVEYESFIDEALSTKSHLDAEDSLKYTEEHDQLSIESLFGSGDASQEITISEGMIKIIESDDDVEIVNRLSSAEPELVENEPEPLSVINEGSHLDNQSIVKLLLDDLIQRVSRKEKILEECLDSDDAEDIIFINEVNEVEACHQNGKNLPHNHNDDEPCLVGKSEKLDNVSEMFGLTRPELRRWIQKQLNTRCTDNQCLAEKRMLKQQRVKDEQIIKVLKDKLLEMFNHGKTLNARFKQLKESHLNIQKALVLMRTQIAALKSDETIALSRTGHVNVRIPSTSQSTNSVGSSQRNNAIIAGIRPNVSIPTAARSMPQVVQRSRSHQNANIGASPDAPLNKRSRLEDNASFKMSQCATASVNSTNSVNGSPPKNSPKTSRPLPENSSLMINGLLMPNPLLELFGHQIVRSNRINIDIGLVAAMAIPLPMQTSVLPRSIEGHRLPTVTTKANFSPLITMNTPIENLMISKKLHGVISYQLPSTISDMDSALGIFYYLRSELAHDQPPNWKIGCLTYPSETGKSKLCFDFSQDAALNMEGILAIAVLFTRSGHFASEPLRYDIPDKRMQALASLDRSMFRPQ